MKRVVSFLLSLILISVAVTGIAYEGDDHDKILEKILFGKVVLSDSERKVESFSYLDDERQALRAIELASFLAVDLYSANRQKGIDTLNALHGYRIWELPQSVERIIYKDGPLHGRYTHLGWDHVYEDDQAKWRIRKKIMLSTTEKVFNFRILPSNIFGYDEQCDSFAALVYYVHVVADFANDEDYDGKNLMPLAEVFKELEKHLDNLFDNPRHSHTYTFLRTDLNSLRFEALGSSDTVYYANKLLELLKKHVHELLKDEPFFTNVFPRLTQIIG